MRHRLVYQFEEIVGEFKIELHKALELLSVHPNTPDDAKKCLEANQFFLEYIFDFYMQLLLFTDKRSKKIIEEKAAYLPAVSVSLGFLGILILPITAYIGLNVYQTMMDELMLLRYGFLVNDTRDIGISKSANVLIATGLFSYKSEYKCHDTEQKMFEKVIELMSEEERCELEATCLKMYGYSAELKRCRENKIWDEFSEKTVDISYWYIGFLSGKKSLDKLKVIIK